jgi:hypothetical protein
MMVPLKVRRTTMAAPTTRALQFSGDVLPARP